jgi:hypothetical protein
MGASDNGGRKTATAKEEIAGMTRFYRWFIQELQG